MMFKGSCVKCRREWYGWALQKEEHCVCDRCGGILHVVQEDAIKTKVSNSMFPSSKAITNRKEG